MSQTPAIVRCAIYTRELSYHGPDDLDPDGQYAACRACIEARAADGWTIIGARHHDDIGAGFGLKDRPGLERLQIEVENGALDRLVVHTIGCLTPSLKDLSIFGMFLNYGGCSLVAAGQGIDTATQRGAEIVGMMTSLRGFEAAVIAERMVVNRKPSEGDLRAARNVIAMMHRHNAERAREKAIEAQASEPPRPILTPASDKRRPARPRRHVGAAKRSSSELTRKQSSGQTRARKDPKCG